MFNDIDLTKKGHCLECFSNPDMVRDYAKKFMLGHWSFLTPGEEETWYGTENYEPEERCNSTDVMVSNFEDSRPPFFRASCALDRGRCTIHFSADPSNAELRSQPGTAAKLRH